MGYEVDFRIDTGARELWCARTRTVANLNYTSNCAPMFRLAFASDKGLHELNGLTGRDARAKVKGACDHIERDAGAYRALNPANGWGDSLTCYAFLRSILTLCERYTRAKIFVSA